MQKQMEHIEVAVRARPLNNFEMANNAEPAWEIRKGGVLSSRYKQRSLNRSPDRRMAEMLSEGQEKTIQLKNKYRFGFDCQERVAARRAERNGSMSCRASNQVRSKSAAPFGALRSTVRSQTGIGKGIKAFEAICEQAGAGCARNQSSTSTVRPSASGARPGNGFRTQCNTPYYTPTPRYSRGDSAMENTPHHLKDVTEFSLYPAGAQGAGTSSMLPSSGANTRRQGDLTKRGNTAVK